MAPDVDPNHPWMYVASGRGNAIAIYDIKRLDARQIGEITDVGPVPNGLALDALGTLYVANWNGNQNGGNVEVFPAGATSPSLTLTQDLSVPLTVAVDSSGSVFVVNRGTSPSVVVFPPGQTTPSRDIASALLRGPEGMALDSAQNLYVADGSDVTEIPVGSSQPVALNLKGLSAATGVTFDPLTGNLFVSDRGDDEVLAYAPGQVQPSYVLKASISACDLINGTMKNHEYLYVPDCFNGNVSVFRHDAKKPRTVLNIPAPGSGPGASQIVFKAAGVPRKRCKEAKASLQAVSSGSGTQKTGKLRRMLGSTLLELTRVHKSSRSWPFFNVAPIRTIAGCVRRRSSRIPASSCSLICSSERLGTISRTNPSPLLRS